jgi:hypothetical protein
MSRFLLESRAKKLPDIQRNWAYEVVVPAIADVTGGIMGDVEDLIIRVRSAVIPARGNDPIESHFFGMSQLFPSKPVFEKSFDVVIEETEDQMVLKALQYWQNQIYNVNIKDANNGSSQRPLKRDLAKDIYLLMYKYNQDQMERKIRFYNAFPRNVGDVPLSYDGNESVKFSVTFAFDFWVDE